MITTKEANEKIRSCKALQGKTVQDCISSPAIDKFLMDVICEQTSLREEYVGMYKRMTKNKMNVPAHVIDYFIENGLMTAVWMKQEYLLILHKGSNLPVAKRNYVYQLVGAALSNYIRWETEQEFPELKEWYDAQNKGAKA